MNNSHWESFMKFSHLTIATFSHIESCNSRICNSQKLAMKFEQISILPISNPIVGCKILYLHDKEHFSCFKYSRLKEKALILHGDIRLYNYLINPPTPEKKNWPIFVKNFSISFCVSEIMHFYDYRYSYFMNKLWKFLTVHTLLKSLGTLNPWVFFDIFYPFRNINDLIFDFFYF